MTKYYFCTIVNPQSDTEGVFELRTLEIAGSGSDRIKTICSHGQNETIHKLYRQIVTAIPESSRSWLLRTTHKLLSSTPDHIQEEFEAVSDATEIPMIGIATLNFLDELARLADLDHYINPMACSSLGVFSPAEKTAVVGRNLDYGILLPELRVESRRYYHRDHGHGYDYISWSWPGFLGIVTGLNSEGIWLATHTARSVRQSVDGVPNGILYRMVMEQTGSIEEARDLIFDNLPTCASNVMLADLPRGEIVVYEVDNQNIIPRFDQRTNSQKATYVACTNHFVRLSGSLSSDSYLRQYYMDSEAAKIPEVSLPLVAKTMASPGILNDITVYSLVTDGQILLEQTGDGLPSDESHYEAFSLSI